MDAGWRTGIRPLEVRPESRKSIKIVTPPDMNFPPKLPRKGVSGRASRGVKCKAMALPDVPKKVPERAILDSGNELRVGSFHLGLINLGYIVSPRPRPENRFRPKACPRHDGPLPGGHHAGCPPNPAPTRSRPAADQTIYQEKFYQTWLGFLSPPLQKLDGVLTPYGLREG